MCALVLDQPGPQASATVTLLDRTSNKYFLMGSVIVKIVFDDGREVPLESGRYQTEIDGEPVSVFVDVVRRGPVAVSPAKARFSRAAL